MSQFKPMLASAIEYEKDWQKIRYPLIASPKLDGIRAIVHKDYGLVTRSLKPVPNKFIQSHFTGFHHWNLDGELIIGDMTAPDVFQQTTSGVMSVEGKPTFQYYVFDHIADNLTFLERYDKAFVTVMAKVNRAYKGNDWLKILSCMKIKKEIELREYEARCLAEGYEGIMIRSPDGPYKYGRSSVNEGYLLKIKRFADDEAEVIGFEPLRKNINEATTNLLGYVERSTKKGLMIERALLGNLIVRHPTFGEFSIGSGMTELERFNIWVNREDYLGKRVTFKYQVAGMKDKPRFPIFKGFRGNE